MLSNMCLQHQTTMTFLQQDEWHSCQFTPLGKPGIVKKSCLSYLLKQVMLGMVTVPLYDLEYPGDHPPTRQNWNCRFVEHGTRILNVWGFRRAIKTPFLVSATMIQRNHTLEALQNQFLGTSLLGLIFQDKYNKRKKKKKATELHFSIFIFQFDDKGLEWKSVALTLILILCHVRLPCSVTQYTKCLSKL